MSEVVWPGEVIMQGSMLTFHQFGCIPDPTPRVAWHVDYGEDDGLFGGIECYNQQSLSISSDPLLEDVPTRLLVKCVKVILFIV